MKSLSDATMREQAYVIIQEKLLDGEIRAGDLISELGLAEQIGMSRTPIREAIGRLEFEGLFEKVPRVGTLVRLPGQRELAEMYEVRQALEGQAASVAVETISPQGLEKMGEMQRELLALIGEMHIRKLGVLDGILLQRYFDADIGFHAPVLSAGGNRRILKIVGEFRVVQRVFEYGRMSYGREMVEAVAREHGEILSAMERRDANGARLKMMTHIGSARDHAMQRFKDGRENDDNVAPDEAPSNIFSVRRSRLRKRSRRPAAMTTVTNLKTAEPTI